MGLAIHGCCTVIMPNLIKFNTKRQAILSTQPLYLPDMTPCDLNLLIVLNLSFYGIYI